MSSHIKCFIFSSPGRRCPLQKALNQGDKRRGDSALEWEYSWYLWEKKIILDYSYIQHWSKTFLGYFDIFSDYSDISTPRWATTSTAQSIRSPATQATPSMTPSRPLRWPLGKIFQTEKNSESVQKIRDARGRVFLLQGGADENIFGAGRGRSGIEILGAGRGNS